MIIGANRKHSTIERPKMDKKTPTDSKETPNSNGGTQSPQTGKAVAGGFSNLQSTGKQLSKTDQTAIMTLTAGSRGISLMQRVASPTA